MISAVILTRNEEKNILACLEHLTWCSEIVIVDDYSTDRTLERISSFQFTIYNKFPNLKIKIFKRKLNNDFATQRNFGLFKAKGEWVLFIDADEVVTKELKNEILYKIKSSNCSGFYSKRRDYFLGREIRFGEAGNVRLLRLAKKNSGVWLRKVHEYWDVKGGIHELSNPILHYPHLTLREFIDDINYYSSLHAEELKKEGKKPDFIKVIIWPVGKFLYNFVFRFGFLDGARGFIAASLMSFHSFLAWSKAWMD